MSELVVKPSVMNRCVSSEQGIAKKLNNLSGEITSIQRSLNFNIRSRAKIDSQLTALAKVSQKNSQNSGQLAKVLSEAVGIYNSAENTVQGNIKTSTAKKGNKTTKKDNIPSIQDQIKKYLIKLNDKLNVSGAVLSGSGTIAGKVFGFNSSGTAEGEILGGSVKTKSTAKWNPKKGEAGIEGSVEAEGHLAKGKLKGNIGLLGGEVSGTVGTVGATGKLGATLFKDGRFSPTLDAKLKAEAAVAKGDAQAKFGSEKNNAHIKGSGTLLGAEAEASGSVGKITYKDETTGNTKTEYGVKGKVGAEAYLAQGKVSGGFTICGIKIDAGISGKAGGVGASLEGKATTGGVSGKIGAGLGLGAGLEISIDWSEFSLW